MHRRIDLHWCFVWILINDFLIHLEKVTVFISNNLFSEFFYFSGTRIMISMDGCLFFTVSYDSRCEIQKYGFSSFVYSETCITTLFGCSRGHISWDKVTK